MVENSKFQVCRSSADHCAHTEVLLILHICGRIYLFIYVLKDHYILSINKLSAFDKKYFNGMTKMNVFCVESQFVYGFKLE